MRRVELSNMYAACGRVACCVSVSIRLSWAWLRSSLSSAATFVKENSGELLWLFRSRSNPLIHRPWSWWSTADLGSSVTVSRHGGADLMKISSCSDGTKQPCNYLSRSDSALSLMPL